jgi:hypothetical protein
MIMVLMNDIYPNAPVLTIVQGPTHGNAFVMGGNHIAYTATGTFSGNDTIRYRICESNECDEALLVVTNNFLTSNHELIDDFDVEVFPNPSSQTISLRSPKLESYKVSIFNNIGQLVMSLESKETIKPIDISNFDSGIYNIILIDKNRNDKRIIKFLKQ